MAEPDVELDPVPPGHLMKAGEELAHEVLSWQRHSYTEEFKAEAVRAATVGDRSLMQVARDLGVNASVLQNWKQRLNAATGELTEKREESLEQSCAACVAKCFAARGSGDLKSRGVLCKGTSVKYAFIEGQRTPRL